MTTRLTVLHSRNKWLGITETWLYNQLQYLPNTICNHVICNKDLGVEQFQVPNLHQVTRSKLLYGFLKVTRLYPAYRQRAIAYLARQEGIQLLHSHFGNEGWVNIGAAERAGIKHLVTFYGFDVNHLPYLDFRWYDRYQQLFEHVDAVLCEGPFMAQTIVNNLGCPPEKMRVHRLGIELDKIVFKPRHWASGKPLKVLLAAAFTEKKASPMRWKP